MQLKKTFFFIMYKMFIITAETLAKNYVHAIKVNKTINQCYG